jgi:hypothetical protein
MSSRDSGDSVAAQRAAADRLGDKNDGRRFFVGLAPWKVVIYWQSNPTGRQSICEMSTVT